MWYARALGLHQSARDVPRARVQNQFLLTLNISKFIYVVCITVYKYICIWIRYIHFVLIMHNLWGGLRCSVRAQPLSHLTIFVNKTAKTIATNIKEFGLNLIGMFLFKFTLFREISYFSSYSSYKNCFNYIN